MDTTIVNRDPMFDNEDNNQTVDNKKKTEWKKLTIGGVTGVLLGAGAIYAANASGSEMPDGSSSGTQGDHLNVASSHSGMSFSEAFAAARAEVGPGGVFHWHGGIYSTFTAEEWNAMSDEEKSEFAELVRPEISASHIAVSTPSGHPFAHTLPHDNATLAQQEPATPGEGGEEPATDPNVVAVSNDPIEQGFGLGDDVHIVATGKSDGHLVVGYDVTGDNQVDVAVIDVNDNMRLDENDYMMDTNGNIARVGDVINTGDENGMQPYNVVEDDSNAQMQPEAYPTVNENPDVAMDMPDYMNNEQFDGIMDA